MATTTQQISGRNPKGKYILSGIAKRTYKINKDGSCSLHEEQKPIIASHVMHPDNDEEFLWDTDLYPFKTMTDIVVKGIARSTTAVKSFEASVSIGKIGTSIQVFADRKLHKTANGVFQFISENTIEEIPISYAFAYGGKDLIAEAPLRKMVENDENFKYASEILDVFKGSPYRYPRNPIGKGYLIDTSAENIEQLQLPNIENPFQLLTPETIVCKNVLEWYKMPIPVGTEWIHPGWFPRIAYFGKYALPKGLDENITEIAHHLTSDSILKSDPHPSNSYFDFRACNGASLGLQSRFLVGGESCLLTNMHPQKKEFLITLPKESPKIKVDGRNGKLLNTDPVIHSVTIEPEENLLTIVWCGSAKAIRPYMQEELEKMPFEVKW
ncbi:MAG: DUF2169 domain-containing protein [Oceanihabitans sp.]|nr:DUF2169 domain-containing protein [Oceanihabitans sp.]